MLFSSLDAGVEVVVHDREVEVLEGVDLAAGGRQPAPDRGLVVLAPATQALLEHLVRRRRMQTVTASLTRSLTCAAPCTSRSAGCRPPPSPARSPRRPSRTGRRAPSRLEEVARLAQPLERRRGPRSGSSTPPSRSAPRRARVVCGHREADARRARAARTRISRFPAPEGPTPRSPSAVGPLNVLHLLAQPLDLPPSAPPPRASRRRPGSCYRRCSPRASAPARGSLRRFPAGAPSEARSSRTEAAWLRSRCTSSVTSCRSTARTVSW